MSTSGGPSSKFARICAREARHALDEHRLPLAVRADDLRVEGHRELDDRVEARVGAVAREHLLDGDPRVAGAEEVDEPVAGDRVGAEPARGLDRLVLARRRRRAAPRAASSQRSPAFTAPPERCADRAARASRARRGRPGSAPKTWARSSRRASIGPRSTVERAGEAAADDDELRARARSREHGERAADRVARPGEHRRRGRVARPRRVDDRLRARQAGVRGRAPARRRPTPGSRSRRSRSGRRPGRPAGGRARPRGRAALDEAAVRDDAAADAGPERDRDQRRRARGPRRAATRQA